MDRWTGTHADRTARARALRYDASVAGVEDYAGSLQPLRRRSGADADNDGVGAQDLAGRQTDAPHVSVPDQFFDRRATEQACAVPFVQGGEHAPDHLAHRADERYGGCLHDRDSGTAARADTGSPCTACTVVSKSRAMARASAISALPSNAAPALIRRSASGSWPSFRAAGSMEPPHVRSAEQCPPRIPRNTTAHAST